MQKSPSLEKQVIDLKRWMKRRGWHNETKLTLRDFPSTGRGVCSSRSFKEGEAIIEIPLDLMITYNAIDKSELSNYLDGPLRIHELLALFLVYERHKGADSVWCSYVGSLPEVLPEVPWIESGGSIECDGGEECVNVREFYEYVKKCRNELEESVARVEKSIRKTRCFHCEENTDRVFDVNLFTWGYVMVNTRAVHVDPGVISTGRILLDEPSMALCPYLDMFNHSDTANTTVSIDEQSYKLITSTSYKKHQQIFISYGPHSNKKLICEYGFYIPFNRYDVLKLSFAKITKALKFTAKEYKYAKEKHFNDDLTVSLEGLSFNLKALLYISLNDNQKDCNHTIYTSNYSQSDLQQMRSLTSKWVKDLVFPNASKIPYIAYLEELRRGVVEFLELETCL